MSWDKTKYPADWPAIARKVKEKAGWRCRWCSKKHNPEVPGDTLTVHHLDGDPANCDDSNLRALCQRCHLKDEARVKKLKRKREVEKTQKLLKL